MDETLPRMDRGITTTFSRLSAEVGVEVIIKNKKTSGYKVYLPKEFEQVVKRVILSSLQNSLKKIEAEIYEM